MAILPGIGYSLAESAISITTNQSVYEYGDHLVMIINVSEITGDDASVYIIDSTERRSLLLQQQISQEYTEFPSKFPFDATIWKPAHTHTDNNDSLFCLIAQSSSSCYSTWSFYSSKRVLTSPKNCFLT